MKHRKNLFWLSTLLSTAMFFILPLQAQVTIGTQDAPQPFSLLEIKADVNKGGLRLPQLSIAERNALHDANNRTLSPGNASVDSKADGLVIYNTDTKCVEYWKVSRWISLCTGSADFIFWDDAKNLVDLTKDANNHFPWQGETKGPWTPEGIPPCEGIAIPYGIYVVTGIEYTYVTILNPASGRFILTMDENPTARIRTAIVRVTNNCTGEYKDYLFTQDANTGLCQPGVNKPDVAVYPSNTVCSGGAVYMRITNFNPSATYIWTYNDVEIERGRWWYADKRGIYRVYVGAIGCSNASDLININISGTTNLPAPVIFATNDGVVCSGGKVILTATNYGTGTTVRWFKDGEFWGSGASQEVSSADDAGNDWIAVSNDGTCYSLPSNIIRVTKSSLAALAAPNVSINGFSLDDITYCKGGLLNITINNMGSYTGKTVNFIFKNGNEVLNVTKIDDSHYQYVVPTATNSMLFSVTVQEIGGSSCGGSQTGPFKTVTSLAPAKPIITSSTNFLICATTPVILQATMGYSTYTWYKDGVALASPTGSSLTTLNPGKYSVNIKDGSCISEISDEVEVKQGGNPAYTSILGKSPVNKDDVETYAVTPEVGVTYQWLSGTYATLVTPSSGTSAVYKFPQDGVTAQVKVQATNGCGTITIVKDVTVSAGCTPPVITGGTPANSVINLIEGQTLTLSVNTTGTAPTFQWYKNGSPISGATSAVYTKSNVTLSDGGVYKIVVTGSGSCSGNRDERDNITVNVIKDPSTYPPGSGNFAGRTCFDVVETNNGGDCGTLSGRQSQKANFTQSTTYRQTYTFTTSGTVSKIRFYAVDQTGLVIDSIMPGSSTWSTGTYLSGTYTVTVYYKTDLNTTAAGRSRSNALIAKLYVVYNDQGSGGGADKRLELKVSVQDCTCCPGYLGVGKEYVQKTPGYVNPGNWPAGAGFSTVSAAFTATGKDVCFYKTDNTYGMVNGLSNAKAVCNDGSFTTDPSIQAMGWRLPTIAELGSIDGIASNLSNQPTSITGTTNMVVLSPAGSTGGAVAYYWSSTEREAQTSWEWSYGQHGTQFTQNFNLLNNVRCVRTQ